MSQLPAAAIMRAGATARRRGARMPPRRTGRAIPHAQRLLALARTRENDTPWANGFCAQFPHIACCAGHGLQKMPRLSQHWPSIIA